jgi:hypothetical protein
MRPNITHLTQRTMTSLGVEFDMAAITGKDKTHSVVNVRHLAMWLTHRCLGMSFSEIAAQFCRVDHTNVSKAIRKIDRMVQKFPDCFMSQVAVRLEKELRPMPVIRGLVATGARVIDLGGSDGAIELDRDSDLESLSRVAGAAE